MVFQAFSTGYLITTTDTILLTGKRDPPVWLSFLTVFAAISVLVGGILLLLLLKDAGGMSNHQDIPETFLGVVALLMTVLFPANLAINFYLRLENPITIQRSSILNVEVEGSLVRFCATLRGKSRPICFRFNTRCQEEAENIRFNLAVHAHGRLRCYPITFIPKHQPTVIIPDREVKGPIQL